MQEQPNQAQPQLHISDDVVFNTNTDSKIDNFIEEYDLIIGHLRDKYVENDYLVKFGFSKQEIESTMKVRNKLINNPRSSGSIIHIHVIINQQNRQEKVCKKRHW